MSHELNPYQPPASLDGEATAGGARRPGYAPPASRWVRLVGAAIDGLLWLGAIVLFGALSELAQPVRRRGADWIYPAFVTVACALVVALQGTLISRTGQSVGKMITGTRIVRIDGQAAGLVRGLLARTLLFPALFFLLVVAANVSAPKAILQPISVVMMFAWLVDKLWILGPNARCFHDVLAGTVVQTVQPTSPPVAGEPAPGRRKERAALRSPEGRGH